MSKPMTFTVHHPDGDRVYNGFRRVLHAGSVCEKAHSVTPVRLAFIQNEDCLDIWALDSYVGNAAQELARYYRENEPQAMRSEGNWHNIRFVHGEAF